MDLRSEAKALEQELVENRRWLHRNAEVAFDLTKTKEYVRKKLEEMGISVRDCGRSGLVADISGEKPGKTILLRADMDALPIPEESGVPFACETGAMHACGHDLHTSMLLGAAKLLKAHEKELQGTVRLMFQPAEEIFEGAMDMIRNGVLENPKPDAALMIHVTAAVPMPAGMLILCAPGVSAPAADYFTIRVQGRGCHGSTPQNGVDALTAASHILLALQEIHARELAPSEEAVLTIGTFRGGSASNVIADSAELGGTIRTYSEQTRGFMKQRMTEIAEYTAKTFRATATVEFGSGCPTLVNDKDLAASIKKILSSAMTPGTVLSAADFGGTRGGGSEDFAYVSQQVPTLMMALAAGSPADGYDTPLHHPKVTFDERAMVSGTAAFAIAAMEWLNNSN